MASDRLQFAENRMYKVRRDFTSRGNVFSAGDVVVFRAKSFSCYDGITEMFFIKLVNGRKLWWTVSHDECVDISREAGELFEEITANEDVYPSSPPPKCSPDMHDWELSGGNQTHELYVCRNCGQEKFRNLKTNLDSFVCDDQPTA